MRADEVNKHAFRISELLNYSLWMTVNGVFERCKLLASKPEEPDFIAGLVIDFTPKLYEVLKFVFPKVKISVTGVYCHQKPIVDIGYSKSPEIGDVLFVYSYTNDKGIRTINSLLLQAKISKTKELIVPASEVHQLQLYLKWPDFTYMRAGRLTGEKRGILPKTINDGAQYLLIDTNRSSYLKSRFGLSRFPFLTCAIPNQKLIKNNSLSDELVDFMKFKAGRIIENDPKITKDDWTKMVWEMIDIAKSKASKRKNMGIDEFPRLSSFQRDGFCFVQSDSKSIFSDLKNDLSNGDSGKNNFDFYDEENIGLSVVFIEVDEEKAG